MRQPTVILGVLACFSLMAPRTFADKPAEKSHLTALEPFVGEWEVDGKWSNGEALHARGVYTWGLGKKILTAKTFVRNGDQEYQRYESILTWHPEKKSLYEISFTYDGSISEVLIDNPDKNVLHIGWTPYDPAKPSKVRQVIKFLDADHFQWTVTLKDGEEWKPLIDATWQRKEK
jgi:hypothetical protein